MVAWRERRALHSFWRTADRRAGRRSDRVGLDRWGVCTGGRRYKYRFVAAFTQSGANAAARIANGLNLQRRRPAPINASSSHRKALDNRVALSQIANSLMCQNMIDLLRRRVSLSLQ